MPRRKTFQPAPLDIIETGEFTIEVIDKDTRPIGRGQDKAFNAGELDFQVLNKLVDMYLSKDPAEYGLATELLEGPRKASKLSRQLELWGYEEEDRALREHAKAIRKHWVAYKNAMVAHGKLPNR
jgi:hypothetical protein